MKRLMIIGASRLQLPAILKAKELGLYTLTADYNPNAEGIPYADEYVNVSTIDEAGIKAAAEAFGVDGIMTIATDMPMRALAYTAEALGLPGISYETSIRATDKEVMIRALDEHHTPHPDFRSVHADASQIPDDLPYPVVVKPTDNSGSRGVMLAEDREELLKAAVYSREHGRSGNILIEEYLQGPEVSVEVMTWQGKSEILAVTDKLTTGAPHFVEMGHSQPSVLPEEALKEIRSLAVSAVEAIGIENGPAHVEIILTAQGPKIVELGARMGGDCIASHLVPLSTGIDMVGDTIRIAIGEAPEIRRTRACGSAIRYFRVPEGRITEISGVEEAEKLHGVIEVVVLKKTGEENTVPGSSADRMGYVIAQGTDAADAVRICEEALGLITIRTDKISTKN